MFRISFNARVTLQLHNTINSAHTLYNENACHVHLLPTQSWQKVETNTSMFTPDITPLVLAAHRNNYEILKILLDRGASIPMPHDIR